MLHLSRTERAAGRPPCALGALQGSVRRRPSVAAQAVADQAQCRLGRGERRGAPLHPRAGPPVPAYRRPRRVRGAQQQLGGPREWRRPLRASCRAPAGEAPRAPVPCPGPVRWPARQERRAPGAAGARLTPARRSAPDRLRSARRARIANSRGFVLPAASQPGAGPGGSSTVMRMTLASGSALRRRFPSAASADSKLSAVVPASTVTGRRRCSRASRAMYMAGPWRRGGGLLGAVGRVPRRCAPRLRKRIRRPPRGASRASTVPAASVHSRSRPQAAMCLQTSLSRAIRRAGGGGVPSGRRAGAGRRPGANHAAIAGFTRTSTRSASFCASSRSMQRSKASRRSRSMARAERHAVVPRGSPRGPPPRAGTRDRRAARARCANRAGRLPRPRG